MGILSKEAYEGKREYAARKMAENKEIETLTKEQHEFLEELCTFRHELHTSWDSAFNTESSEYKHFADQICPYHIGCGNEALVDTSKRLFGKHPFKPEEYDTSNDVYDYLYDEGYETESDEYNKEFDRLKEQTFNYFSRINEQIESFLREIDSNYGTEYCPTGFTRI